MIEMRQQATANGQLFPAPREGEVLYETPPVFTWRRDERVTGDYCLTVQNARGETVFKTYTDRLFAVADSLLPPGNYRWRLTAGEYLRDWQGFSIAEEAVRLARMDARELLEKTPSVRPRHLFFAEDIPTLRRQRTGALNTLKKNIELALADGLPEPPRYHMDDTAQPYREYFGRHRRFCDRNLMACALGHALLDEQAATQMGVNLLLTICSWNPDGPCSVEGPWGDELGLSHARCLPAAYDLLFDALSDKQRILVERTIAAYARQCEHLLLRTNFCDNPGSSHSGRLPAYLGEAALALKGTCQVEPETLVRWLKLALDVYGSFFPYYGGADGGWAEGAFYATSYTRWYLPFFSAVRRYSGFDFLLRPFYQRLVRFFQHFCPPGWENHPFCDGYWCHSEDEEWPGFFAQNPLRMYADRFGDGITRAWREQLDQVDHYELHLMDIFLPDGPVPAHSLAGQTDRAHAFPDAGFLSLHTDPAHPQRETVLLARASRFGSVSHQHADQGSFALIVNGKTMISPSGYFGRAYGTRHHLEWTNTTRAHNTLLVNGEGQKTFSFEPTGRILSCEDAENVLRGAIDPSGAYPQLTAWERRFELREGELLVIDHVEAREPVTLSYLLHTLSRPEATQTGAALDHGGVHLEIAPLKGLLPGVDISDRFAVDLNEGEPDAYHVQMPPQYHLTFTTRRQKVHDLVVAYRTAALPCAENN